MKLHLRSAATLLAAAKILKISEMLMPFCVFFSGMIINVPFEVLEATRNSRGMQLHKRHSLQNVSLTSI
ncbi:MAG: hypothetical protein J6I36_04575 [Bacteroidaceae bacterium]|nr:hypothetical protein [Bacteroidaceae bacterium]